ncbi:anthranilate phosphoribosyltransferase [Legionella spiritensis]|uniref:anthranilate phosphoribosyltransferase n=1 Tax=Legionella spiritensis TaxID=452 RepID=UPI000F7059CE|nr:anthranilate phosphoribosyltransferase [Legionella spiritensis]VEG89705.1 anthranilate phosphoribosyltransferase [Legionella spiritensis]
MNTNKLFEQLIAGDHLNDTQMQEIMKSCMSGELSDGQITAFLALMRMKGETVDELTTAAHVMMEYAHCIDLGNDLIDIVGTGGDGKNTFNVSTVCSIVAAAAGAFVAKHGNRSVSGRSGSTDVLTQAGIELQLGDGQLKHCMEKLHICFLFAPHFHTAMQHVRVARQQLGIRSFFNLLGPLINPARVRKQVVGVFSSHLLQPVAQVLKRLGSQRALVIHSRDGLDEISISDITDVVELHQGQFKQWSVDPRDYHCHHASLDGIIINSPEQSLRLIEDVLNGQPGPARDIVLLNTAAALFCAGTADDLAQGIRLAAEALDTGKAKSLFYQLKELTQTVKKS